MIRVLVVDDSAFVRKVLSDGLNKEADIEVVGQAADPYAARRKIVELEPDVLTLDIEMPRMDGLTFLEKLMKHRPMPVVVVSSLTPKDSELAFRALALGAVSVVPKPGSQFSAPDVERELAAAVRAAAASRPQRGLQHGVPALKPADFETTDKVIAIGSSTGGTVAVESILAALPATSPGVLIVQHLRPEFTASFAAQLDAASALKVKEAEDGAPVVPGTAYVGRGGRHLLLKRSGGHYYVQVKDGPPVHHQKPAVDVLFKSAARAAGANAVGVILTGMGRDGAEGLLEMKEAGAHTIAQDEASCVVYGMPRAAVELGAAAEVLPLERIPAAVLAALRGMDAVAPATETRK